MPTKLLTPEAIAVKNRFVRAFEELRYRQLVKTQKEFCELVGLANASNLKRIKDSDSYEPTISQLCLLIKKFNVSAEWLMTGENDFISKNSLKKPK